MKRIAYSFLLIFLFSCSSLPSSSSNRITIEFRDSVIKDFYLLAVRDSALVVTPYTTDYASIDSLNAQAQVVPFKKVGHLYKNSSASLGDELWAGATGLAIGGCVSGFYYIFDDRSNVKFNFALPIEGLAGGLVIGVLLNNAYAERFLDSKEHLEQLKFRATIKMTNLLNFKK